PDDLSRRGRLGTVPHRAGYGLRGATAPNGASLALTALPADGGDLERDGQLWLLETPTGALRLLLEGVSARGTPVWAPDSRLVAAKRLLPDGPHLVVVDVTTGAVTVSLSMPSAADLFPVGWTPDGGTLYVAVQTPRGFDLAVARGTSPTALQVVAPLAAGPARDFRLDPAGRRLSYLAPPGDEHAGFSAYLLDLERVGQRLPLNQRRPLAGPALGAAWQPGDGGLTLSLAAAGSGMVALRMLAPDGTTLRTIVPAAPESYDVPLSWSPDGRYLAVRHLTGPDLQRLSGEALEVLGQDGRRARVTAGGTVAFVGWLPPGRP
ncbi:MAG: hypothetical protein HY689_13970, partial [Chloroflexi bacterium]|nr:hypothetical protein [Chloroflexota bacterium]